MAPTEAEGDAAAAAEAAPAEEPAAKKQKTDDAANDKTDGDGGGDDELHYPTGDSEIWKSQTWTHADGTVEDVIEMEEEPRHDIGFTNDYTRIITIKFPPKDVTIAHRHISDTIIIICMEDGIDFINDVLGSPVQKGHMKFGQVGFAPFTAKPCIHKITNLSDQDMFCINVEVLDKKPPLVQAGPMTGCPKHELVNTQHNCRVYKLKLDAGESAVVNYRFFYVRVVLRGGTVKTSLDKKGEGEEGGSGGIEWEEKLAMGDSHWKEPCVDMKITNVGDKAYEAYICEFK